MTDDTSRPTPTPSAPTRADVFDQYMPILLFLVLNSLAGLAYAIGAMTLWAVKAQISRYRRGLPLGRVMPIIVVYLLIRGTLGIIYDSEEVYFGIGISAKGLAALALLVSAALRRNATGYALPYLVPIDRDTKSHPEYRATTRRVSIGVALVVFASVGFDIWLLQNASINKFVLIRLGVNWGLSIFTLLMVGLYLDRRLRRVPGFPGMMPLIERRLKDLGMNPPSNSE
jgi:intracellular septation protein A